MKHFPTERLRPSGGSIRADLFENAHTGVPLGIYWAFCIEFDPLPHEGEVFHCNLMAEFVELPIRDWRHLTGRTIRDEEGELNVSFYTVEHDPAVATSISIVERRGTEFLVEWASLIDYPGWSREERDPRLPVNARAWVPFEGILIYDSLVKGISDWRRHAATLLAGFIDLEAFGSFEETASPFGTTWRHLRPI